MRIGVLTSGGDCPGMNAAIRSVVRTAAHYNMDVFGINRGYAGLLEKDIIPLNCVSVAGILQFGGTILRSSRSQYFTTEAGLKAAAAILKAYQIDVLVVIGGDGSLTGAQRLSEYGVKVIGIPATIDNDFGASDYTIGFDTAVTTAIDAIAKIKDTTYSHNRINLVQVMGRKCGDIALYAGYASGAEGLIIPEIETDIDDLCDRILCGKDRGKLHCIIMLAEGCGHYDDFCHQIEARTKVTTRGTNLGYIQRGGSPTHFDRCLASQMGYQAVKCIADGEENVAVVSQKGAIQSMPLKAALAVPKELNRDLYDQFNIISL